MNKKPLQSQTSRERVSCRSGGFALALILCAVVILFVIGAGVLKFGLHSRGFSVRTSSDMVARCAADAGMTKALYEMNEKLKVIPWDDSLLPDVVGEILPNSDATYSYAVTSNSGGGYSLESKGKHGLREKVVNCSLSLQGPFEAAILARLNVILKSGTLVDGYNSGDPWDTRVEVQIGTMSILPDSVVLNSGVVVNGNIVVGVGGDVETVVKDLGASTYRMYAMLSNTELELITPPEELVDKGSDLKVQGATLTVGPTDNGQYGEIELKKGIQPGLLVIDGGDVVLYITGDISLGQSCEIVIRDGSTLALYLDGDMSASNNAGINNQSVPTSFTLYGTSTGEQSLILKAKSESFGAIYAPNADIIVMASGDIYGAITGKSVELKSGGNFYYDEALREVSTDDQGVHFVITGWSEE
ncbi:MAG: hypothetical protein FVQ85_08925 [Planctomycetes bacterium]|nr:hypothetical protein [Planctomycetota bacterium]